MNDEERIREQTKYKRVWNEIPEYGNYSPGLEAISVSLEICKGAKIKTVLDAGCGSAKATKKFADEGYDVVGVDLTLDGVAPELKEALANKLHEGCLWDLEFTEPFDMIYCVDVLEHIPPNKVYAVLSELARLCNKYAYFKIAKFKDGYGSRIGEPLHLSLFNTKKWETMLSKHFTYVVPISDTNGYVEFLCEKQCQECCK